MVLWGDRGGPHEGRRVTLMPPLGRGVKKASTGEGEMLDLGAPACAPVHQGLAGRLVGRLAGRPVGRLAGRAGT